MANKNLFGRKVAGKAPVADTVNRAGGLAYSMPPRQALAQIACTNCFNNTYYASDFDNLVIAQQAVEDLKGDPEFIAKVAVYARDKAYMKDMPAFLVAYLATLEDKSLFRRTFRKVIRKPKMLRNFVQIGRSGVAGKVLNMSSSSIRAAIQEWFDTHSEDSIFRASVGNDPSLKDILSMARPRPEPKSAKAALYAYLTDTPFNAETQCFEASRGRGTDKHVVHSDPWANLPEIVRQYETYKKNPVGTPPDVEFRMLTSLPLGEDGWKEICRNANWTTTRMNLQTFARHGVFNDAEMVSLVAKRLSDADLIRKTAVFPYELLMAYRMNCDDFVRPVHYGAIDRKKPEVHVPVPAEIREALQDAMEITIDKMPTIEGKIYIAVDVSGSMSDSISGRRDKQYNESDSKVRCVDVASLFASAMIRKNRLAEIYPFDQKIYSQTGFDTLNPRDSVMTNANKLSQYGGGGTDCSLVLAHLNQKKVQDARAVIYISDYESWSDSSNKTPVYSWLGRPGNGTSMMEEWKKFEKTNPQAKLVCCDLTPRNNAQTSPQKNILQIGGWSDQVFDVIKSFLDHNDADHWVNVIQSVEV